MICLNNNLKFTIRSGLPYTDHHLALDGDKFQGSQGYFSSKYSTEEELRRMWDAEEYQTKMGQFFEKQKADLMDIYLKMTENCILKMKEPALSEIFKEEEPTADISEVTDERDKKIVKSSLIIKDIVN